MDIKRYDGEDEFSYIYRVCDAKTSETWDEIGDYLNDKLGKNQSSSSYRKPYQYTQRMVEANKERFYDVDARIEELEQLKEDIRKERQKLHTVNLERNRIDREDGRWELFYENIGQYVEAKSKYRPKFSKVGSYKNNNMEYLLGIADVHGGASWSTSSNEFSMKILQDRFDILLEKTEAFINEKNLTNFNIVLLGDLIDGVLRISNLQMQDTKVSKACADISEIIGEFVDRLTVDCHVHINLYDAVYGNHSTQRYLGTTNNYDMLEDLGYTISRYIQCYLRNNANVDIFMPKDNEMYLEFELNGFNFIAFHGHTIKNLDSAIKDLTMRNRKFYDYSLSGHIHSSATVTEGTSELHDVQDIRFPSFCGSDPYADSIFKQSKGSALIVGFDKDFGYTEMKKFILN